MEELNAKIALVAQSAARKKQEDPTLGDRAAQIQAALDEGYKDSWLDGKDDLIEGYYKRGMTTLRIQRWPGHKYWGWFFTWPWGFLTWLLIAFLLFFMLAPKNSYRPVASLASLNSNVASIQQSLARLEALAPQIEVMNARSLEAMKTIDELKEFTRRVEKTKMFRKNADGYDWKKTVFGK